MSYPIRIENIGGIREGSVSLTDGLNAIRASNWTGKSSFLAAVKTVMGTGKPLTESAGHGCVELEMEDEEFHVELRRENGTIIREGKPYITDELSLTSAELFAFLDEDNEIRDAVRRGENLEELLTRPLDIENIDIRIDELLSEREQVDSKLESVERANKRLPSVQERETQLEAKLDNLRAQRAAIQTGKTSSSELIQKRDELSDLRAERDSEQSRLSRSKSSIERNEAELERKCEELASHEIPDRKDVIEQLESKRENLQQLEHDIELLQSLYSANKRIIAEDRLDLVTNVDHGLLEDSLLCWVCNADVDAATIKDELESLADRISEMEANAEKRYQRIETLESKLEERRKAEQKAEQLRRTITQLEETIADHEQNVANARNRIEDLEERIERLTEKVDELDDEVTDIESEIKVAERELSETRAQLQDLKAEANQRDTLKTQREEISAEIRSLRDRRDKIKRQLRETFDEEMQDILRRCNTGIDGARLTPQFDIIVARNGRQASLETLSEGERELLGVITALTGYDVFDLEEDVPVVLLDNLGGFDEKNLSTFIKYLDERVECLIFTSYPEHDSIDASEIELAEWKLVSEQEKVS